MRHSAAHHYPLLQNTAPGLTVREGVMMALRMAGIVFCVLLMVVFAYFGVVFNLLFNDPHFIDSDIPALLCFGMVLVFLCIMTLLFKSREKAMRNAG